MGAVRFSQGTRKQNWDDIFIAIDVNRFKFGHLPNGVLSLDYGPNGQRHFPMDKIPPLNYLLSWTRVPINNINDYCYWIISVLEFGESQAYNFEL